MGLSSSSKSALHQFAQYATYACDEFYQFRKNTFMLFSKKFAHEIHEVSKDQYLKQLTKVDFHYQFEINDTKRIFGHVCFFKLCALQVEKM
jgi:hypothetical protein